MAGVAAAPAIQDDLLEIELQQLIEEEAKKHQLIDLLCPYCGWMYSPQQGCFCFRLVSWDELT
jgi:hypothetical protein